MMTTLHYKKISMHAVETMYHGAILYKSSGKTGGKRQIDGNDFVWSLYDHSICVVYRLENEVTERCLDYQR
jgi:hypothetical protein